MKSNRERLFRNIVSFTTEHRGVEVFDDECISILYKFYTLENKFTAITSIVDLIISAAHDKSQLRIPFCVVSDTLEIIYNTEEDETNNNSMDVASLLEKITRFENKRLSVCTVAAILDAARSNQEALALFDGKLLPADLLQLIGKRGDRGYTLDAGVDLVRWIVRLTVHSRATAEKICKAFLSLYNGSGQIATDETIVAEMATRLLISVRAKTPELF